MSSSERASEPTMDEILESIRRIISDDDEGEGKTGESAQSFQEEAGSNSANDSAQADHGSSIEDEFLELANELSQKSPADGPADAEAEAAAVNEHLVESSNASAPSVEGDEPTAEISGAIEAEGAATADADFGVESSQDEAAALELGSAGQGEAFGSETLTSETRESGALDAELASEEIQSLDAEGATDIDSASEEPATDEPLGINSEAVSYMTLGGESEAAAANSGDIAATGGGEADPALETSEETPEIPDIRIEPPESPRTPLDAVTDELSGAGEEDSEPTVNAAEAISAKDDGTSGADLSAADDLSLGEDLSELDTTAIDTMALVAQVATSPSAPEDGAAAAGDTVFEASIKKMIRPMLRDWLDENLPRILEVALREELESPSKFGR